MPEVAFVDHSRVWDEIMKCALVGTDRQKFALPAANSSEETSGLETVLSELGSDSPESVLLGAAAVCAIYRRAGQVAGFSSAQQTANGPQPNVRRSVSRAASLRLQRFLAGHDKELLSEWLSLANEKTLTAPEELLPDLLELARKENQYRSLVTPILDHRGRWLAEQNPQWNFVAGETSDAPETVWQEGTKAQRLELLGQMREENPGAARELLETTWNSESPADRADFIQVMRTKLSLEDEEFLESALDDKRKEVRTVAGHLLADMPDSKLVARMWERVRPLLKIETISGKRKNKGLLAIEITLPEKFDDAMARDGIVEKQTWEKKGEKAGWVSQMLARVPPQYWEKEWQKSPQEILELAGHSDWYETLLGGWSPAAMRYKNGDWAEALIAQFQASHAAIYNPANLASALPASRLETLAFQELQKTERLFEKNGNTTLTYLLLVHKEWSEDLSRAVIAAMQRDIARAAEHKNTYSYYWLQQGAKDWALKIPPSLAEEAAQGWPTEAAHWEQWKTVAENLIQVLEARRDMQRELDETA